MPTVDLTRIGSNIGAMYSLDALLTINNKLASHQTRLATGKRINSAADDPAGLVIATKMHSRSEGLRVVQDNISDAKNMLSVAESGLGKLTDIITKMRSKATQAASDTLGASERQTIQTQLSNFAAQVDDILAETKWNGVQLLDGSASKVFQTGVDYGETTTWAMSTDLSAETGLGLSTEYVSTDISNTSYSTSITGGAAVSATLTAGTVDTGTYSFEILDAATSATTGTVNLSGAHLTGVTGAAATTGGVPAGELASGDYLMEITAVTSTTTVSYRISNDGGATWDTVVAGEDISGGGVVLDAAGNETGLTLTFATDPSALTVNDTFEFEYIAADQVKAELNDAGGVAVQIDNNGDGVGTTSDTAMYVDAGGTANTGRGLNFTLAAIGSITAGETASVDFHDAGTHVIDVSTASKAATYMNQAEQALDKINSVMADLGSLMARMDIKEEAAASSRINVEAAYNRIMNANMAEEQVEASKYLVLQQTAIAMLAQANQAPQSILSLFR
ncbi:MAG: flagellin [Anaerolineaceae bacterium]|nr:flagellin [Anaerolineaceae bacterium]